MSKSLIFSFFGIKASKSIFFNIIRNEKLKGLDIKVLTKMRIFINEIVLSLYSHRFKIESILFYNILRRILYLFIYNFLKIRLYYLKEIIKLK